MHKAFSFSLKKYYSGSMGENGLKSDKRRCRGVNERLLQKPTQELYWLGQGDSRAKRKRHNGLDVCAGSKENVKEDTYKFPLIKSGDGSVYQNMDDWKRTRFSGKAQQFSLGNTEFQVALSHPTEI